jgi:ribose transport system ATP-binding protein
MEEIPMLEMKGITKRFPGVLALDSVDFSVNKSEVHALVGENGAGKSTLMKILGGAYQADEGAILLQGESINIQNPSDGIDAGINVVYQELVLAPHLSAAENIMMGQQPRRGRLSVDWGETYARSQEVLEQIGIELDIRKRVKDLSVVQQQIVEIARALQRQSRILVLDEPSAVLGKHDIELLYAVINRLKARGISIVYISHRLEEIFLIADRVTVLKDGRIVATKQTEEMTEEDLVQLMIGHEIENVFRRTSRQFGNETLRVTGLSRQGRFEDINFTVREGEILGIAGLVGSGRTDIARVVAGVEKPDSGSIQIYGKQVNLKSSSDALRYGIGLLPEDRNKQGLFLKRPIFENVTISSLFQYTRVGTINLAKETKQVQALAREIGIVSTGIGQSVTNLSGGNRQKVVLARWLGAQSKLLIFDEPTRGVDVGAKVEIYRLMNALAAEGVAIIMISSEMQEILGMADNIIVLWRGTIATQLTKEEATREKLLQAALIGANNNGK